VRCRTAHLALSIFSELGQKLPFLAADPETRFTPLPMMASGVDHDKRPCGRIPHHNGRQSSSHRARMDASSSQALPSVRWVFTLCWLFPGVASCHDAGLCLLIGVVLCLLQMWWSSSCKGSSLPGRGSWIAGKVPSWRGKMIWQLLSALWEGHSWNVMLSAIEASCPAGLSG
jgi:hypothetical protein